MWRGAWAKRPVIQRFRFRECGKLLKVSNLLGSPTATAKGKRISVVIGVKSVNGLSCGLFAIK